MNTIQDYPKWSLSLAPQNSQRTTGSSLRERQRRLKTPKEGCPVPILNFDSQFKVVFGAIRQLMAPGEGQKKQIGFHVKEKRASYGKR